jgi:hypothetical protein
MPGGFQTNHDLLSRSLEFLHQEVQPSVSVLDGEDQSVGLVVFVKHTHGMLAHDHVDAAIVH